MRTGTADRATSEAITVCVEAIAVRAPMGIKTTSREWTFEEEFGKMRDVFLPVRSSNDSRDGALALQEKRAPQWTAT